MLRTRRWHAYQVGDGADLFKDYSGSRSLSEGKYWPCVSRKVLKVCSGFEAIWWLTSDRFGSPSYRCLAVCRTVTWGGVI